MNLIGKWKTKEILSFSAENGVEWKTLDELAAMGEDAIPFPLTATH